MRKDVASSQLCVRFGSIFLCFSQEIQSDCRALFSIYRQSGLVTVSSMCTLVAKLIELRLVFTYMVPTRLYKGRAEECTIFYFLLALLL